MTDPTDDEQRLAEEIADEALEEFDPLMTPAERAAIKDLLVDDLLFTEAGRLRLRAATPDPSVDRSGDVERAPASKKKVGTSS